MRRTHHCVREHKCQPICLNVQVRLAPIGLVCGPVNWWKAWEKFFILVAIAAALIKAQHTPAPRQPHRVNDMSKYTDSKLFPFPGLMDLKRRDKAQATFSPAPSPGMSPGADPANNWSGSSNEAGQSIELGMDKKLPRLPKLNIPQVPPMVIKVSPTSTEYFGLPSPQSDAPTTPPHTSTFKLPTTLKGVRGWLSAKKFFSSNAGSKATGSRQAVDDASGSIVPNRLGKPIQKSTLGVSSPSSTPRSINTPYYQSFREDYHSRSSSASLPTLSSRPVIDATKPGYQRSPVPSLVGELLGHIDSPSPPTQTEDSPRNSSASGRSSGDEAPRATVSSLLAAARLKLQQTLSLLGHHDQHRLERGTLAPGSFIPADSGAPAWKRLIRHALLPHEVISLINIIFTNEDEVKMIFDLRADDAQPFINAIHKVYFTFSLCRGII